MEIQTQIESISPVRKRMVIEVPADVASREFERLALEYRKQARLAGFRRGKAPLGLVKQHFGPNLREDVLSELVPKSYEQALQENQLAPLGQPELDDVRYSAGEPLKFTAEFEILPEITLPEYKKLKVSANVKPVTDEDVERALKSLQERHSVVEAVEDRSIQEGDYAVIDLEGQFLGEPTPGNSPSPINESNMVIEVGSDRTHPEFNKALLGMNAAEENTLEVDYPEDYSDKNLAGQRVRFKIKVREVKRKILPELNDEFARGLGDYKSVKDVAAEVRADLQRQAEGMHDQELRNNLVKLLVERTDFETPESLIEERIDDKVRNLANRLSAQGINPAEAEVDWKQFREDVRPTATQEAKGSLILDKIAEQEQIEITSEEINAELAQVAASLNRPPEQVRQQLLKEDRFGGLVNGMKRQKAVDLLLESADTGSG